MDATTLAHRGTTFVALGALTTTMDRGCIGEGIATDLIQFISGEITPLTHGESLQTQWTHLHAPKLLHRVAKREQHAADLAIAALEELHVEDGLLPIARDHVEPASLGLAARPALAIAEKDPALKPRQILIRQLSGHRHLVALVHLVARVRESVGELTVVGHEQQPR